VDANDILVRNDDMDCSVQVTGAGRLLAVDNGNQGDLTPLTAHSRKLHDGRALAIVESEQRSGPIIVKVTSPGLPEAELKLQSD